MSHTEVQASAILDGLTAGVLVVDAGGCVRYANQGAGKILRQPVEELSGRAVSDVLVGAEQLGLTSHASKPQREVTIPLHDGETTVVGFSVGPADSEGARTILFQEITAILELRRERDRLLQMAALGDALPSILHELRNPLAAVTSALEILVEEVDEATGKQLHTILWEVRRMNLTLQGVGGLARAMHSDRHVAVDLAVVEACRILEGTALRHGVSLATEVPTLPLLPLDWGVVSGIVFNLVKNAIEACEAGDVVTVRANLEPGDTFELSVADNGPGMTPEVLGRCRQLFFTSKQKGSGIGLALCQQIAESSGAALDIVSAPGAGTRVTISVPLFPPRGSSPSQPGPVTQR